MPGNLRYGLTSGLSTASKKRRPGKSLFGISFFTFQIWTRIVHPFHFISRWGFDSAPSQQRLTSFLGVYYTDITQYITLRPPPQFPATL